MSHEKKLEKRCPSENNLNQFHFHIKTIAHLPHKDTKLKNARCKIK